jgi:arsenate reductase (thioredoxin)
VIATRRQFLATSTFAAAIAATGCLAEKTAPVTSESAPMPPKKVRVLFVCVENSNRSQMAQAFATMYGGEKVEALSAGSKPKGSVNPKAIAAMKELGYDLTTHTSKGIEPYNGQEVDAAVTMGCGDACPLVKAKNVIDWQIPDPRDLPADKFNEVRDLIGAKVKELLKELGV